VPIFQFPGHRKEISGYRKEKHCVERRRRGFPIRWG